MKEWRKIYSTKEWRGLRMRVFNRAGWRCEKCGKRGRLECDHIKPISKGGDAWDLHGMQALCRSCHIAKTAEENMSSSRKEWAAYLRDSHRAMAQKFKMRKERSNAV